MSTLLFSLLMTLPWARAAEAPWGLEAIYGADDRCEIDDPRVDDRLRTYARSTAVIVSRYRIGSAPKTSSATGTYRVLPTLSFRDRYNLCAGEAFAAQPAPGYCSAFLVGPGLVLTAGHCVRSSSDCSNIALIFDFVAGAGHPQPQVVPESHIFYCQTLEARRLDESSGIDYALIRLDRVPADRAPLPLRYDGLVEPGAAVTVLGHPNGLPLKVTRGGRVRRSDQPGYFVINADTFSGNSGSPVINDATGLVEGIAVRGDADFEETGAGCRTIRRRGEDEGRGEDVTRIIQVLELARESGVSLDP